MLSYFLQILKTGRMKVYGTICLCRGNEKVSVSVLVNGVKYILCNVNMRMMWMKMRMKMIKPGNQNVPGSIPNI